MKKVLVASFLAFTPAAEAKGAVTTAQFLEACKTDKTTCQAYIIGFVQGLAVGAGDEKLFCAPAHISSYAIQEAAMSFLRYRVRTHPRESFHTALFLGIVRSFPCDKE